MEQEQILSELKTKIGNTSLSDRTLGEYVKNNIPSEGDPDDAWYNKHTSILKSLSGNFNSDVAATVNKFKEDWNKTHQSQQTTQSQEPNNELEEIKKQMAEMKASMEASQRQANEAVLRSSATSKASDLNVSNPNLWADAVKLAKVEENSTEETFIQSVKAIYEANQKRYFGEGAKPYSVSAAQQQQDDKDAANKALDDLFNKKRLEGSFPKKDN